MKTNIIEAYPCLQGEGMLTGVPSIMFRFTGCPMRCQFSATDFCDSWYTSWRPEKADAQFNWLDISELLEKHQGKINHAIISGGSPTMHNSQLKTLTDMCAQWGYHITVESEGSKMPDPFYCDLLSLSPKLSSSIPQLGSTFNRGEHNFRVKEAHVRQHERNRCNYEAMKLLIANAQDHQLKFVVSKSSFDSDIEEILLVMKELFTPASKVYLMPAGSNEEQLNDHRVFIMEKCVDFGFKYSDRLHIIAYGDKRGV